MEREEGAAQFIVRCPLLLPAQCSMMIFLQVTEDFIKKYLYEKVGRGGGKAGESQEEVEEDQGEADEIQQSDTCPMVTSFRHSDIHITKVSIALAS